MANYEPVQNMSDLYGRFRAMLGSSYTPQSASTLKDAISRALRPGVDKNIQARQDTGKSNRGEIIAEAGGRGMGTSSAVTDRLMRSKDAEARDIANMEADYEANRYNALLNQLNRQDELSMEAENNLRNSALGLAQGMYGQVYGSTGGGGGWGRGSGTPKVEDPQGLYEDALAKLKKEGYTTKSAVNYLKTGNKNLQYVQKTPTQPTPKNTKKYSGFTTGNK